MFNKIVCVLFILMLITAPLDLIKTKLFDKLRLLDIN